MSSRVFGAALLTLAGFAAFIVAGLFVTAAGIVRGWVA